MKKKTILIAGGSGFIGSNLLKSCLEKNWKVVSLSLNNKRNNKKKNVSYINFDISDKVILRKKLNQIKFDYIVNLAGHINHS